MTMATSKQTEVTGEVWKREVLWDSDLAMDVLHPMLGPVWTAILQEALRVPRHVQHWKHAQHRAR